VTASAIAREPLSYIHRWPSLTPEPSGLAKVAKPQLAVSRTFLPNGILEKFLDCDAVLYRWREIRLSRKISHFEYMTTI
jgi:hypothetical protein